MSGFHLTLPATTTVVPVALTVAAVLVESARRHGTDLRVLAWRLALVAYLAMLLTATFFPFRIAIDDPASPAWWTGVNTEPGRSFALVSYKLNVLMTVPLGVLVPAVTRYRNVLTVTAVGALTSCSIELAQLAQRILLGGDRSADVDDVIANTLGTAIGVVAFHLVVRHGPLGRLLPPRRRRSPGRPAVGRPGGSGRPRRAATDPRVGTRASSREPGDGRWGELPTRDAQQDAGRLVPGGGSSLGSAPPVSARV